MKPRPHHRPFDRTVKLRDGEKVLIVDGEDELFLEQTVEGVRICDARRQSVHVEIPMLHDLTPSHVLFTSRTR